jgi:excisionase family DNA binding protein
MFNLIRRQEIPAIKIGKSYRIRQSDLDNYLRKQQQNMRGE